MSRKWWRLGVLAATSNWSTLTEERAAVPNVSRSERPRSACSRDGHISTFIAHVKISVTEGPDGARGEGGAKERSRF